ncbi:MAG: tetratricopeptide repeat protein, partial [Nannocystaceae bacterium]
QLGQLYAQGSEPAQAIKILEMLRKEQPEDLAALQNLARLLARTGRKSELLELTEREVELTKSNHRKAKLLHRAAELALELDDRPRAFAYLEDVLKVVPDHSSSVLLLERCLRADGDKPRLLELLRTRLDQARDRETRISLRLELAGMLRQRGEPEQALTALDELLREHPRNLPALHMSERLAAELGLPKLLASRIEQHAGALRSPHTRALHLYRAAQIHDRQLADTKATIVDLERALELSPQLGVARGLLLDICQANGDHERFMRTAREALVWERGPSDRRAIALQMAERTPDSHPALRYLTAAATARPGNLVTQRRIVRIARLLARHEENRNALRGIADELLRSGRKSIGRKLLRKQYSPEVLGLHYLAAQAAEASGDAHTAAAGYEALIGPSPIGVLARRGQKRALALRTPTAREAVIKTRIGKAGQAKTPDAAAVWTRAAQLLAGHGALDEAVEHADRALALCPEYLPALHTKAWVLGEQGSSNQTADAIKTLQTMAGLMQVPEHRVDVLCRAGRLALHTENLEQRGKLAWALFADALRLVPTSRLAFHGLWQTCARFGGDDAPSLSSQLLRRVEALDNAGLLNSRALRAIARIARESDGAACCAEILEHGQAIARKNPVPEVSRAVSGDPGLHVDLARAYAEANNWPGAVTELEQALECESSRARQATLHYLVADALYRVKKPEMAISHYIRASAGGYHPRRSLRIADSIAAKLGNPALRKKVLEPLLKIGTREDRGNGLRALVDIERSKPVRAVAVLRTYLKIRPRDTDAICELADL